MNEQQTNGTTYAPATVTGGERKKVGPHVDAELWDAFRNLVIEKHGGTSKVLGSELEKALVLFIRYHEPEHEPDPERADPDEKLQEINQRLRNIERKMDGVPTDE